MPDNWPYVNTWWSWIIIGLTMLPETIWPFVYIKVHTMRLDREERNAVEGKGGKDGKEL